MCFNCLKGTGVLKTQTSKTQTSDPKTQTLGVFRKLRTSQVVCRLGLRWSAACRQGHSYTFRVRITVVMDNMNDKQIHEPLKREPLFTGNQHHTDRLIDLTT